MYGCGVTFTGREVSGRGGGESRYRKFNESFQKLCLMCCVSEASEKIFYVWCIRNHSSAADREGARRVRPQLVVAWPPWYDINVNHEGVKSSTQSNLRTVNHLMNPHLGSLLASRFTLTDVDAIFVDVSCTAPHSNVLPVVTGSALQLDRRFQVTGGTVGKV